MATNPTRKIEAVSWIFHDHGLLKISKGFEHKASIKKRRNNAMNAMKSQEELREFFRSVLQRPEAKKVKRFKTKRKTHAEVIGLQE